MASPAVSDKDARKCEAVGSNIWDINRRMAGYYDSQMVIPMLQWLKVQKVFILLLINVAVLESMLVYL